MWKMIKTNKNKILPWFGFIVCAHTQLCIRMVEPRACILNYAHASFNADLKNYIFIDLIKQRYNIWDKTSMLET